MIHKKIKEDLSKARKNGEETSDLIFILGELARLIGNKDGKKYMTDPLNDMQSERVLNKILVSSEKLYEITGIKETIQCVVKSYLPEKIDENEIKLFLDTVDFSQLNNKMQAVGLLKKKFGNKVDGKMASEMVMRYES